MDISNSFPLSPEREVELAVRIQSGDIDARNELVNANLRFVISVAKQYMNSGVPIEDLINEGNIGLIHAAERFDPTRGFKFSTFAVWWIRQAITSSLTEISRTVRLPINVVGQLGKLHKEINRFEQINQRQPSADELADKMSISVERIQELMNVSSKVTSLDVPLSDDSDSTMTDVMVFPSSEPTDARLINESLHWELNRAINSLPERQGIILRLNFGLDGQEQSLDEIANRLHLTRERVRQLREKAIHTLQCRCFSLLNQYIS